MTARQRLTRHRKATFLRVLLETGVVRRAAAAASPGARDSHKTFYDERRRNPDFAASWAEALDAAIGDVEKTLLDVGSGRVVVAERTLTNGTVEVRYANPDSRALQLFLAARCPEYRRQTVVEANLEAKTKVEHQPQVEPEALEHLSTNELLQLESLLAKAASA